MKNLLKKLPMKLMAGVAAVAIVAGVASTALAGFGPNRETRVWSATENGFDHVTFDSYTGVPNGIGDERDFLRGVQVGRDTTWSDPVASVDGGAEVEVKMYIHNNADPALNSVSDGNGSFKGIAHNVTVKAEIPTATSQTQTINGSISADNATPGTITDTLDITAKNDNYFNIAYVPGSAQVTDQQGNATAVSDSIVTTGANIGDQNGCFQYVREVTFKVKVQVATYQIQKAARLNGEDSTKWRKVVNAKVGDKVDYRIYFTNVGTQTLEHVAIVDNLPPYVSVVPGSIKSAKGQSIVTVPDSAVSGQQINIDSGDYSPGDDSYLQFTVTINNVKELACGAHQLNNNAFATPKGYVTINDYASVNVISADCATTTPTYVCGGLTTAVSGMTTTVKVSVPFSGGATFKYVSINYGDGSTAKVTNNISNGVVTDSYTYKKADTYKITATAIFTVNGADKSVSSDACTASVTIGTTTPPTLPNTGAGNTIGLFAAVAGVGAVAHNMFVGRRNSIR